MTGEVIRSSKQTATRYERDRPGELVHMDVKKIGRIPPDAAAGRPTGEERGSIQRDRSTKVGFDYVHSLVDDHSRLAYSEALPDEKGTTCAAFLERAIAYFAAHGITQIERLMTDNAWAYRYSLRATCTKHGIVQKFIRSLPVAEREGRKAEPHPGHRVGLPPGLHQQRPACSRPCSLDRALQH